MFVAIFCLHNFVSWLQNVMMFAYPYDSHGLTYTNGCSSPCLIMWEIDYVHARFYSLIVSVIVRNLLKFTQQAFVLITLGWLYGSVSLVVSVTTSKDQGKYALRYCLNFSLTFFQLILALSMCIYFSWLSQPVSPHSIFIWFDFQLLTNAFKFSSTFSCNTTNPSQHSQFTFISWRCF